MSVICTDCGRENGEGAAFCDECGSGLAARCPECGTENRADAKFCRSCGTRLSTAATPVLDRAPASPAPGIAEAASAERRLISVLFADLVAFTEYSEGRDPELVRETLTRYFEASRGVIERHGGTVEKFIGDAVMAEWGAPRANEDDAERAVRAALEVVEAVRNLGEGLHARVAVLTGQAAVTVGAVDQGMVAGDLVNTAARLQGVAPPDTVLVGEATMQAASGAIAFEEAGEQVLKGKAAPVRAWRAVRVVGDTRGRGRSELLEPPFVGRDLELRLLKDLIDTAAVERRPRLVSITGPAGIGKSRLAWEFEKYADGLVQTTYWHRGRSPSYGDGIAFWALGEMVRRRAGLIESDTEATNRERIHATVAEFIDDADAAWVEQALLALLGLESPPPGGREALFAAWRTFFERVASVHPTVMLFEDLHWADDGQLDFIDHLLEWSRNVPLLVITLARPELLERRPGWGTGARSFNAIGLEPLSDANMRGLLLGLVPDLPSEAVAQVLERADGIPLYAVEILRMLIADGRIEAQGDGTYRTIGELGALALPDTLRALVASRLDGLDAADRALLQDATVLGQTFDHRALAHITDADEQEVEARLRALTKRELLEISVDPRSPERGHFGFVQSVLREVAYETLARRDRRERHLAAARYFEATGDDELAAVLATHYFAAYEASDEGPEADALAVQARLALRGAAERAVALGSPDQAVVHLETALRLTTDPSERGSLLLRASEAAAMTADLERAGAFAQAAVAAFGEARDQRGALGASSFLGAIMLDAGDIDGAVSMLERVTREAEPYPDVHADLLARLARAYMRVMRHDEAVAAADRALAIAEPLRLDRIVAEALVNKGSAMGKMRRVREPLLLLEAGAMLAREAGDVDLELRARANLGATLYEHDASAARRTCQEARQLALRLGMRKNAQWLGSLDAILALDEGVDWAGAAASLDASLDDEREPLVRITFLVNRLAFLVNQGQDTSAVNAELETWLTTYADLEDYRFATVWRATALALTGSPREGVDLLREAIPDMGQDRDVGEAAFLQTSLLLADPVVMREAEQFIRGQYVIGNAADGRAALSAAGVAALEGRSDEAIVAFREAIERFGMAGWNFAVAQTRLFALRLLPGRPELDGWADEARARFELLGAEPWLRLLDEAVARGRSDTLAATSAPRPEATPPASLVGGDT
jgi:class 3 adenylate cyclase/tetratricopeptide (TPR) repeat protein